MEGIESPTAVGHPKREKNISTGSLTHKTMFGTLAASEAEDERSARTIATGNTVNTANPLRSR
jgi:hypothetical protein